MYINIKQGHIQINFSAIIKALSQSFHEEICIQLYQLIFKMNFIDALGM